jgi:ubiquinone/menaquinone biosynthesis C-methylase UbiE
MPLDPRDRFSGLASVYQKHRPSYPPELLDWLLALPTPAPPRRAVDLGCGTGIASRLLAGRGLDVVGVDPNWDMLRVAASLGGGPRYVRAQAEATGLADACADLVTAAQCFHWFDRPRAFTEMRRILRPGAWAAAWWNDRAPSPLNDAYEDLLLRYSEEYPRTFRGNPAEFFDRAEPALGDLRRARFRNVQRMDREGFLGRVASASYVEHGLPRREEFFAEVAALFDRCARDGVVAMDHDCRVFAWR